jgi:hypothetical protein
MHPVRSLAAALLLTACGPSLPGPEHEAAAAGTTAVATSPGRPARPGCGELKLALYAPMVALIANGPSLFSGGDGTAKLARYRSDLAADLAALALVDPELKRLADDYREAMSRLAGELAAVADELRVATELGNEDAIGAALAHYQHVDDDSVERVDARYRALCEGGSGE